MAAETCGLSIEMRHARRISLAVLLIGAIPVTGTARNLSLDAWISVELTPYVTEQLRTHPRFKDQSLRFVVLANGNPQARSNALALGIRDRLREAASAVPGVHLAWQPNDPHYRRHGAGGIDCTKSEVDYLVGFELELDEKGLLEVAALAFDVRDGSAVPGFGKTWKGPISSLDYRKLRRAANDPTFRGERDVPYDDTQIDLLAAHLAHDLGCSLLRQTEAEYVVARSRNSVEGAPVGDLVELVGNNLAQFSALSVAPGDESANAVIEGKAHRIDSDLFQYWVTVRPNAADSEQRALSASAYVRLPEQFAMAELFTPSTDDVPGNDGGFLASLEIVEIGEPHACRGNGIDRAAHRDMRSGLLDADCYALSVQSENDAVVFFLNHQLNHGLVRLGDPSCLQSDTARIVKSKEQLRFALPVDALPSTEWAIGDSWPTNPQLDTFYAVAANSSKAARELSQHVRRLPKRCSASVRPGLEGPALRQWLDELARMIEKWQPAIDWRSIRVRNVY